MHCSCWYFRLNSYFPEPKEVEVADRFSKGRRRVDRQVSVGTLCLFTGTGSVSLMRQWSGRESRLKLVLIQRSDKLIGKQVCGKHGQRGGPTRTLPESRGRRRVESESRGREKKTLLQWRKHELCGPVINHISLGASTFKHSNLIWVPQSWISFQT